MQNTEGSDFNSLTVVLWIDEVVEAAKKSRLLAYQPIFIDIFDCQVHRLATFRVCTLVPGFADHIQMMQMLNW